ncbi:MAG TPA: DEAD/DEAH box helicase [Actinomycetota bacterium]|nr:DEAD/DEAH box helicase [Actinomycetota bacterium]
MDPLSFLERLRAADPESLAHVERIPERRAETAEVSLTPEISVRLKKAGIGALWAHQAEALEHLRAGRHTAVATGTASGKSLCYQLATLERLQAGPKATALYLFPTKALAQDQLRQLRSFAATWVRAAVYDGDTAPADRQWIKRNANLIVSNPDMLHFGVLPQADKWAPFFANLALIVVDEMHTFRGVFGSHVANVLRRVRRLAEARGAAPLFACASATIGNPGELASRLTGLDFEVVTRDGSPRGTRFFALWNPPVDPDRVPPSRTGAGAEAAELMARTIGEGANTIAFAKSRRGAEMVAQVARSRLERDDRHDLAGRVAAYRAGYLAEERRALERALADGDLAGIAATTALELGIDIGGLDACIIAGYPGTIAATMQQAGRAGRRQGRSLAMLVANDDPLDQYLMNHPDALFGRPIEAAILDHSNPNIMDPHVACAAYEQPIDEQADLAYFGPALAGSIARLREAGLLRPRAGKWFYSGRTGPHPDMDIRSMGGEVRIVEAATGALIGTASGARAPWSVHPGAIYLHQGEQYRVATLDLDAGVALVEPNDEPIYTQPRDVTDIRVLSVDRKAPLGATEVFFGTVEVTNQVVAYARKHVFSGEIIDVTPLELPPRTLTTHAVWYTAPHELLDRARIDPMDVPGAAHAAEHAAIGILPLFAMCDRWDIGGVSTAMHGDTGHCTVFIYDGYPGGAGIAARAFGAAEAHQRATMDAIRQCPCETGCPSCVQSPKCGNGNSPLDKLAAVRLLEAVLGD